MPYPKVLHRAAILDPALMVPLPRAVEDVPLDDLQRPYPYVLPPCFPGTYPSIAFMGELE